ncbi:hypothetical protein ACW9UR_23125 [Halovulum sp. GXIMD14794]
MVDHLHRDPPGLRPRERARDGALQALPSVLVDLALQGVAQGLVGYLRAGEVGLADEETFARVVGVDEPAGDVLGLAAFDLALGGAEDVDALQLHPIAVAVLDQLDVRLAEDDEQVAAASLQISGHVQVGVHSGVQDRDAAKLVELLRVSLEVEGASDDDVEAPIGGLAGAVDQVGAADGTVLGADEDRRSALGLAFHVAALGGNPVAGPGRQAVEPDRVALVLLLYASLGEVLHDRLAIVLGLKLRGRSGPVSTCPTTRFHKVV